MHRPVRQKRRFSDRPLSLQGNWKTGNLASALHLPWLPLRPGQQFAVQTSHSRNTGASDSQRLRPGGDIPVRFAAAQPTSGVDPPQLLLQLHRHSHRLPAPRKKRLDRRRAAGAGHRILEFRRGPGNGPFRPDSRRHPAAQRTAAGHRALRRMGIQLGQRPDMGHLSL
ncbi:hypothetical protein SDC9_124130 [bioreactor metagenome]|uniref:Uncharacterized protein n=1 Tax=bioreactor metagenome TaxID=1076179 RepID=A0A645CJJ4_9ZZZZ